MRKTLLMVAVLLIVAGMAPIANADWFGDDRIDGSGKMETRSFDFDDFDGIRLDGGMDIDIRLGSKHSIEVTLDDNLFDNLEIGVKGDVLRIGWDDDCDPSRKTRTVITMPSLTKMMINGAGDVEIEGFDGGSFDYTLRGAGDLKASGNLDDLEISLHGAGDVEFRDVQAKHVDVTVAGVGDVEVTATESIKAVVNGVGDISFWGDPDKERTSVHGIGDIKKR